MVRRKRSFKKKTEKKRKQLLTHVNEKKKRSKMFIKNSCSYISKKWKVLTYSFSKIIEKYIGNSSFLIKLHTYSLQLYLKLLKTSLHLYRFCQLLRNSYFSSFLANASPIKKPSSRLLPAKCVKNTSGRIIFFKLLLFRICFSLILL